MQRTLFGRLGKDGNLNLDQVRIDDNYFKGHSTRLSLSPRTAAYAGMVAGTPSSIGCVFRWKWKLAERIPLSLFDSHPAHVGLCPFRSPVKPWIR